MNSLLKRTISGIVFVAIIVWATAYSSWSFYSIWALVGLLSVMEYVRLISKNPFNGGSKIADYLLGGLYILVPIGLILTMDPAFVLTFVTIVWANDTGAFLVGTTIGKHKMAPSISPKKSWEGFFGGVVFAVATALVWYSLYWSDYYAIGVELFGNEAVDFTVIKIKWAVFGLFIALAAVVGDLVESKFKRTLGVKDSGSLIPGHGGMLDRFDATFLAAIVAWVFLAILDIV